MSEHSCMRTPEHEHASAASCQDDSMEVDGAECSMSDAAGPDAPSDRSTHVRDRRGCAPQISTRASQPLPQAESSAAARAQSELSQALPQLSASVLEQELRERNQLMFVVGASAPVASGRGRVLEYASKEAVQLGWAITQDCALAQVEISPN